MNEREIINLFNQSTNIRNDLLIKGIGDDCAVLQVDNDRYWVITVDTLVESVHFDTTWHPPEKLGHKSVAVNVSDIAAMGARPLFIFQSLGLPQGFSEQWLEKFSKGFGDACRKYGCCLAGGDTVKSPDGITISLTVIGEVAADQILYRSNACSGDIVWVSGSLGNAAAGLELCRRGILSDEMSSLVEAHLAPKPRMDLAMRLAESRLVHSMMDISDGLATDLAHLCRQSNVGALVYSDLLPVERDLKRAAEYLSVDLLPWVLAGGEDYELLFTAAPENSKEIEQLAEGDCNLVQVGRIEEGEGVNLIKGVPGQSGSEVQDISFMGYDHFKG